MASYQLPRDSSNPKTLDATANNLFPGQKDFSPTQKDLIPGEKDAFLIATHSIHVRHSLTPFWR